MQISDAGAVLLRSSCHRNLRNYNFHISPAEVFSRRQRALWLLGRSNFLCNKSHIVGRSFPSIKTSSLSFLQLLRCSGHQSHPIRCLVTVPQLKTDRRLRLPLKSTSRMRLCRQKHDVRSPEPLPDLSAVSALPSKQCLSDVPFRQIFVVCYFIWKSQMTGKMSNKHKQDKKCPNANDFRLAIKEELNFDFFNAFFQFEVGFKC